MQYTCLIRLRNNRALVNGRIPARRFTYLPIGLRLECMFGTARMSEVVQSHCSRIDDNVCDIHDSEA